MLFVRNPKEVEVTRLGMLVMLYSLEALLEKDKVEDAKKLVKKVIKEAEKT